jgi:hypothetical protein
VRTDRLAVGLRPTQPGNTFSTPRSDIHITLAGLSERVAADSRKCCAIAADGQIILGHLAISQKGNEIPAAQDMIAALGLTNNSQALDVYCWLAYRLHSLKAPTPITWPALYAQFGAGYSSLKNFKMRFNDSLTMALAVYPDAKVDVETSRLLLHPSAPAVPKAAARRLGVG